MRISREDRPKEMRRGLITDKYIEKRNQQKGVRRRGHGGGRNTRGVWSSQNLGGNCLRKVGAIPSIRCCYKGDENEATKLSVKSGSIEKVDGN